MTSIRRTYPAHIPLYVCAVLFCGLTLGMTAYWHVPLSLNASLFFLQTVPLFVLLGIGLGALRELVRLLWTRDASPAAAMGRWLKSGILKDDRAGNVFHSLVALTPLMVSFAALKNDIPLISPFSWDQTFAHWDQILTFGRTPWAVLQPLMGHPPITALMNIVYDLWFVVMFGSLIWQAFAARASQLRLQFLLAFAFAWFIAGNVLALVFSSAGPCFYGFLHLPNDPYTAQMHYLQYAASQWPVSSVQIQGVLWHLYQSGNFAFGGISAMPSMHVTIAVIVALLASRMGKLQSALATTFALLVTIGAFRLGWHYSADVIAGAVLAVLFWRAAGWVAVRYSVGEQIDSTRVDHLAPEPIAV